MCHASWAAHPTMFDVRITGKGRPMILIPGLATPGAVWDATVAHFDDTHERHVISLAGFGGTPPAREGIAFSLAAVREELAAYIRARQLDQPIVIGHSLGGFLALDLAATHPELPGPLVIVDGLPFFFGIMKAGGTAEEAKRMAETAAGGFGQMDREAYAGTIRNGPNGSTMAAGEADLERIVAWGLASDPGTVAQAMRDMYSVDLRSALARITSPTLVFAAWVGYKPYSSHAFVEQAFGSQFAALEDVRIEISDTARHFIMLEEPEWMHATIEDFLAAAAQRVAGGPR